jgi:hypothetical protein
MQLKDAGYPTSEFFSLPQVDSELSSTFRVLSD